MITIGSAKFAENDNEFVDSLFNGKYTCVGYAKRYKRKIMFYNHNHTEIACINKWGCLSGAKPGTKDGKKVIWYSYCLPDCIREQNFSCIDTDDLIKSICVDQKWNSKYCETEYWFK